MILKQKINYKMEDTLWIASIDIGKINFCFYIEEINKKQIEEIENISKLKRYNIDGTCTSEFSEILRKIYCNGKKILINNVDITKDVDKNKYFDIDLCHNMINLLNEYKEYWDKTSYIIVEQQMSFGKKVNTMALKLAQNCETYFMVNYGKTKKIIEFPAYHKTQILGCKKDEKITKTGKKSYKNIGQTSRKKWAIEEASCVLAEREDFQTLTELVSTKKKDDLSDTIIQLQAFKYLYFVDKVKF